MGAARDSWQKEGKLVNRSTQRFRWLYLILLIPFVIVLWPPFYNFKDPAILGIPFFYWFQVLWVVIAAVITGIVYLLCG